MRDFRMTEHNGIHIGFFSTEYTMEIWHKRKSDKTWVLMEASSPIGPRRDYDIIKQEGEIYLIGGIKPNGATVDDVWMLLDNALQPVLMETT